MKKIDMVGNKYGHLIVKEMLPHYNGKKKMFCLCDCDCGNKDIVREAFALRTRSSDLTSCGCTVKERTKRCCGREITGQKFGRLLVLETLWKERPPKVKCLCDCGKVTIQRKNDIQDGHTQSCGCLNKEITSKIFVKDWSNYTSESGVKMIKQSYQNDNNQWMWECECPLCGNVFVALPAKVVSNHTTSCGCKRVSSGERIIEKILQEYKLDYISQYSFDDCRYKYKLKFDFAVFKNGKVDFLIEYDGQQHFNVVSIFGGVKALNENIIRDDIKNEYCKNHNIKLLRINYTQDIRSEINKYIESLTTTGDIW